MDLSAALQGKVLVDQRFASFDDLPNELVIGIVSRLPVKTIVQSTCVCKRWYSMIKSPALISAQLSRSISDPSNRYILVSSSMPSVWCKVPTLYVVSDDKLLSHHGNLKIPFETPLQTMCIVGSCNGLVCLTDWNYKHYGCDMYLINPSIQKYRKLSAEFSCHANLFDRANKDIVMGFGYSVFQNDYKVVRIIHAGGLNSWTKAEVYSLKSGKWKVIDAPVDQIPIETSIVSVAGYLYWVHYYDNEPHYLGCFDLDDEVFRKIESPGTRYNRYGLNVFQKKGSVALFHLDRGDPWTYPYIIWTGCKLRLFVMGKDSSGQDQWKEFYYETKDYNVPLKPVGFSSCDKLVYCQRNNLMIAAVNLDDLSSIEKFWLDNNIDTFSSAGRPPLDSDVEGIAFGKLSVDTNFIESLVLLLE